MPASPPTPAMEFRRKALLFMRTPLRCRILAGRPLPPLGCGTHGYCTALARAEQLPEGAFTALYALGAVCRFRRRLHVSSSMTASRRSDNSSQSHHQLSPGESRAMLHAGKICSLPPGAVQNTWSATEKRGPCMYSTLRSCQDVSRSTSWATDRNECTPSLFNTSLLSRKI